MLIDCNKIPNKKKTATRKQASSFSFAVYDSISMVNHNHWNQIVADKDEFLQFPYLSTLENTPPSNMRFHYALIYKNKIPVAAAYFQVLDFTPENFGNILINEEKERCILNIRKYITSQLIKNADKFNMRLLICGNACISGEHGFVYTNDVNPVDAFDALADVIYRISRSEKLRGNIAAVLVKDFYKSSVKYAKELEEFKYHDFLVEPNMILKMESNWNSFDDYLNAMNKKYRNRAKSIIKKGNGFERKLLSVEEIISNKTIIHQLYSNVLFKASFRLATMPPDYFSELKSKLKEDFQITGYFLNKKMVGFKSSFILKKEIEAHYVGFDYSLNKEYELYQNILYDYVKEAISYNKSQLNLGRTASEIKSNIGAKAYELTCYARHRNPLSNRIIKPVMDNLKPEDWTPRNPFKEE